MYINHWKIIKERGDNSHYYLINPFEDTFWAWKGYFGDFRQLYRDIAIGFQDILNRGQIPKENRAYIENSSNYNGSIGNWEELKAIALKK